MRVHVYICIQHVCVCVCVCLSFIIYQRKEVSHLVFYAQLTTVVICQGDLDRGATQEKDFQGMIQALTLEVE